MVDKLVFSLVRSRKYLRGTVLEDRAALMLVVRREDRNGTQKCSFLDVWGCWFFGSLVSGAVSRGRELEGLCGAFEEVELTK